MSNIQLCSVNVETQHILHIVNSKVVSDQAYFLPGIILKTKLLLILKNWTYIQQIRNGPPQSSSTHPCTHEHSSHTRGREGRKFFHLLWAERDREA